MGLDAVEIILRAEEFYSTSFCDEEAAQVRTVGDFPPHTLQNPSRWRNHLQPPVL